MRPQHRRLLIWVLLGACISIATLGEGPHLLAPQACICHQHRRHGCCVVSRAKHLSAHANCHLAIDDHHSARWTESTSPFEFEVVTTNDRDINSDPCGICAFLFQSLSQPIDVASTFDWQPVVVAALSRSQQFCLPTPLVLHAPRGPPLVG